MSEATYTLRSLQGADIFPMSAIIKKIGVKEFKNAFQDEEIKDLVKSINSGEISKDAAANQAGMAVILNIVDVVLGNLPRAEKDIYKFLASLSGMKPDEVAALPMATFTGMVIDVIQKDEFKDFIKVVSRLFKSAN
jgi:hypothetical protein|nr:MAG TPA: hypothetical protein [Caudoviricetes sp.]